MRYLLVPITSRKLTGYRGGTLTTLLQRFPIVCFVVCSMFSITTNYNAHALDHA